MANFGLPLTSLASVANFGSMFTVFAIFIAMVIFIRQFRLFEYDSSFTSIVKPVVTEEPLSKVNLPFSMKLGSILSLSTMSKIPCYVIVCQDVEIQQLRLWLNQPWGQFKESVLEHFHSLPNTLLFTKEGTHDSKTFAVTIHTLNHIQPRSSYALVALHISLDDGCSHDDPAAMFTLIHLPDQYCKLPPTTLNQYLKFRDGRMFNLKPLYSSVAEDVTEETQNGNRNCIVCWTNPATKVLLPCRHACLCAHCFERVENCPVCRTHIASYFSVI